MQEKTAAFGFDFPFGLPTILVDDSSWRRFVLGFARRCAQADDFRLVCCTARPGVELKRITDVENRTSFSPYNVRLYRQTIFGIRDVLAPLVRENSARVLPMLSPVSGKACLMEICPASTLKRFHLYAPYKGDTQAHRLTRGRILETIQDLAPIRLKTKTLRSILVEDPGGDALDSLVAAYAVFDALQRPGLPVDADSIYTIEGHVYV